MRRIAVCLVVLGLLSGTATAQAGGLTIKQARSAAYKVAAKVGTADGASYAFAGYCKRRSSRKVVCWGALVYPDGTAAAQRIRVTKGRKVSASRYGRVYTGSLTESGGDRGGASDEWAVCTPGGFCVGS